MKRRDFLGLSLLAPLLTLAPVRAPSAGGREDRRAPDGRAHRFTLEDRQFMLDGKPFRIRSGEMHPARIPRAHWRHRIRMARAMGLNTIAIYVMWNDLESEPGVFDLHSGNRDFIAFIRLCQREGMWVYLRPGPYICGEWNLGGLPAYLLRDPTIRLRNRHDPVYMAAVSRYIAHIAPQVAACMASAGGPILMLQIENEYSMFDDDVGYLEAIRQLWTSHGVAGPFAVSDGWKDLQRRKAYLPGAALGLDGPELDQLAHGHRYAHDAPVWVGEGYPGWLTHWGEPTFAHRDYAAMLARVMAAGYSFNLYVVHGGTNFGLTAGANAEDDGSQFQPVITSYDYGAPIDERGDATPAFHALRDVMARHTTPPPAIPASVPQAVYDDVTAHPCQSAWEVTGARHRQVAQPTGHEMLFGQDQGLVLYRRRIGAGRELRLDDVRDYAVIHVDGVDAGHVSRVHHPGLHSEPTVRLPHADSHDDRQLEILVDTFGHVNFGPALGDRKGLIGGVQLDGRTLHDWDAWALPLGDRHEALPPPLSTPPTRPGLYFGATLRVSALGDTYLDMSAWDKGYLWVNGHLLGRYWRIGPQQRLYCPAEWLRLGDNTICVLDLHRLAPAPIRRATRLAETRG